MEKFEVYIRENILCVKEDNDTEIKIKEYENKEAALSALESLYEIVEAETMKMCGFNESEDIGNEADFSSGLNINQDSMDNLKDLLKNEPKSKEKTALSWALGVLEKAASEKGERK